MLGPGAVGGYFGARLDAAGAEVVYIGRGAHLTAIREHGLRIERPEGEIVIRPAEATDDPASVGPVDYVLFAVKLFDTEAAAEAVRPLLGSETAVVTLQNGVESPDLLARRLGARHVMGGTAYISSVIAAPGVIRQTGAFATLVFGELDGAVSERGLRLEAACRDAGLDVELSDRILVRIWMKFVVLVALSGVTTATRRPIGELREDPDTRRLLEAAMAEAASVGRARGVDLPEDAVARQMEVLDTWPRDMVASMLHDLEAGKRMELDWFSGAVARLGRELGLDTPVNETLYAVLKPYKDGAPSPTEGADER